MASAMAFPAEMASSASPARPLLLMLAAMAAFVANDTLVKTVVNDLPVGEIVAVRGVAATLFIAAIARAQGHAFSPARMFSKAVVLRASLDAAATLLFIAALASMQIANLTAVMQAVPLTVTLIGWAFLGERVGWRRMLAISIGFCGVLLVVKPAWDGPKLPELLALGVVITVALRDVCTRRIAADVPSVMVALANAIFITAVGAVLLLFQDAVPLSASQLLRLAVAALLLGIGYMCMVATLRMAQLSVTAPARYSIIVFAILSGIFVFGQFPDHWALLGIAMIVITGLYAIYRERMPSTQL